MSARHPQPLQVLTLFTVSFPKILQCRAYPPLSPGPALSLPPSSLFRASFWTGASQLPRSPLCSLRRGLRALMLRVRSEPLSPLSLMEASWEMRIRRKDTRIALLLVLPVTSICEQCHRYSRPHLSTGHTFSGCLKPWIIANPTLYLLCFR